MQREIKYRAKEYGKEGVWAYASSLSELSDLFYGCSDGQLDSKTLTEFTGLCDKNGKEIYEGDICLCEICNNWDMEFNKEQIQVKFSSGAFCPVYLDGREFCDEEERPIRYKNFKVLGNVWENPELLTPKRGER